LKNYSTFPKIAMGHSLVILNPGTDILTFGNKAVNPASGASLKTDYIPKDKKLLDKILHHTKLLGPNETETLEFTAPKAGIYPYICLFPGHYVLMKGQMIVK